MSQIYNDYYKSINLAERLILTSNENSALIQYRLAFKKQEGFAKDYYNSAICAYKINKKKECLKYLLKLADKGLDIKFLNSKNNFCFDNFRGTLWNRFKRNYVNRYSRFYSKNKEIRQKLDSLAYVDQFFRKKDNAYQMYRDTINKIDSLNAKYLVKIIEEVGHFPDENIYGLKDTIIFNPSFYLVIWHQADKSKSYYNFSKIIENAVQNKKIDPNNAALLMQINGINKKVFQDIVYKVQISNDSLLEDEFKLKNNQYLYKDWLLKKKETDIFRLSFGLCSTEEYVAKVKYLINTKREYVFLNQMTFPTYKVNDVKIANSLLKEGKFLSNFSLN